MTPESDTSTALRATIKAMTPQEAKDTLYHILGAAMAAAHPTLEWAIPVHEPLRILRDALESTLRCKVARGQS